MSDEIEAAGALATATMAAVVVPGADGENAAADRPTHNCLNCSTPLTGAYCTACGQRAHIHRSLLHLAEEVLHGVSHFDAKGWRTLPLLLARPGLLTRRYIDGQRTRYVSPLALFLFTVFLMFLVFSLTSGSLQDLPGNVSPGASALEEVKRSQAAVAKARSALEQARQTGANVGDASEELQDALADLKAAEAEAVAESKPESGTQGWKEELRSAKIATGNPRLDASIRRAADNPELLLYKLKNTAYKFSFMLVPISLPFLWLMFFWRRGIAVYDHAVLTLYSLSFMSLLFIVAAFLSAAHLSSALLPLLLIAPPLHMFLHLRETYGLTIFSTLWRTCALLLVAATVLVLFILFIIAMTMG
jgi:hypothetical protein